jgi:H+/Cl- antiporter ClcA
MRIRFVPLLLGTAVAFQLPQVPKVQNPFLGKGKVLPDLAPLPERRGASDSALCVLSISTGAATSLAVVSFKRAVQEVSLVLHTPLPYGPIPPYWALPLVGGLAVALLRSATPPSTFVSSLGRTVEAAGAGAPVDVGGALVRTLAGVCTLGSGCSLGPEGPAVELGATISRIVGELAERVSPNRLTRAQRRTLVCSGAAAGVAAGFNAPLAAIAFAYEVASVLRTPAVPSVGKGEGKFPQLLPIALASGTSALVTRTILSNAQLSFAAAEVMSASQPTVADLPLYVLLGCFCGGGSVAFRSVLVGGKRLFGSERVSAAIRPQLQPIIGGAVCAAVSTVVPQVQFSSYETLDGLVASWSSLSSPADPLELYGAKVIATGICLGTGLVGGLFAPSLFLGAALGEAFSQTAGELAHLLGGAATPPELILTGAASVLAAVFSSPITSALLVFDLTHNVQLVLPTLLSATVASALADELAPVELPPPAVVPPPQLVPPGPGRR